MIALKCSHIAVLRPLLQSQHVECQIDGAKQQWALETKQVSTATPVQSMLMPYLGRGSGGNWPTCPASGTYTIGNLTTAPACNIALHELTY